MWAPVFFSDFNSSVNLLLSAHSHNLGKKYFPLWGTAVLRLRGSTRSYVHNALRTTYISFVCVFNADFSLLLQYPSSLHLDWCFCDKLKKSSLTYQSEHNATHKLFVKFWKQIQSNSLYGHPFNNDTSLLYYGQFALSLRKETPFIFSKFNPLNTDTPLILGHFLCPPSVYRLQNTVDCSATRICC